MGKKEQEDIEETISEAADKRTLLCVADGREFMITIPAGAKVTFSPWSPPSESRDARYGASRGTLRVYETKSPNANILLVRSGVTEFRDLSLVEYEEATEEVVGQRVWKSDKHGYTLHEEVTKTPAPWESPAVKRELPELTE